MTRHQFPTELIRIFRLINCHGSRLDRAADELGNLLVCSRGEPLYNLDVVIPQALQTRVGSGAFLVAGRCPWTVPHERHVDASEALGGMSSVGLLAVAKHSPQREHGFGQSFAEHFLSRFGIEPAVSFARVVAELLEVSAFVTELIRSRLPARPLGAEFRSAGKHGLHFGADCEHGNTRGRDVTVAETRRRDVSIC